MNNVIVRSVSQSYSDDPTERLILRPIAPVFTAHYDDEGRVQEITVDALPPCIKVDDEFLDYVMAEDRLAGYGLSFVGGDEGRLRIETANASCTYRRVDHDFARCQTVWLAEGG